MGLSRSGLSWRAWPVQIAVAVLGGIALGLGVLLAGGLWPAGEAQPGASSHCSQGWVAADCAGSRSPRPSPTPEPDKAAKETAAPSAGAAPVTPSAGAGQSSPPWRRPVVPRQARTQVPPPTHPPAPPAPPAHPTARPAAPPPRPSPIDDGEIVVDSQLPTVIIPPITMPTVDIPPVEMPECILDCPTD
jgi:hypothetical protein